MASPSSVSSDFILSRVSHVISSILSSPHCEFQRSQMESTFRDKLSHLYPDDNHKDNNIEISLTDNETQNDGKQSSFSLSSFIDSTLLRCDATSDDIFSLVSEAISHHFFCVCVNSTRVKQCDKIIKKYSEENQIPLSSLPIIAAVVGFPLGSCGTKVKVCEVMENISHGAAEVDVVMNIGWLMDGNYHDIYKELLHIVESTKTNTNNVVVKVKVIIESSLLSTVELITDATLITLLSHCDFVKTSTGFHSSGGALPSHVKLMKGIVGNSLKVKASGGIRTTEKAQQMIRCGAERIGTSVGKEIVAGTGKDTTKCNEARTNTFNVSNSSVPAPSPY